MVAKVKTGGVQPSGMGTHAPEPLQRLGGVAGAGKPPGGHHPIQRPQDERAGG